MINLTKCGGDISAAGVCEGGGNSFNEEIGLSLKGPSETVVPLVNVYTLDGQRPGGTATWTFADSASTIVAGDLLVSGTYKPASPLSAFNGQSGNGTWELLITDDWDGDPLSVNSWSLSVGSGPVASPVPGPLPLLGAGAAFGWTRRLRKRIGSSSSLAATRCNSAG